MSDQMPPQPPGMPSSPFGSGGSTPPPPAPGAYVPPPGQPAYGQMPPFGAMPQQKSTNGLAIAGFVLGILSIFTCYFAVLTGAVGLVLSIIGLRQVNADPERVGGRGLAIAGIVLSALGLLVWGGLFLAIIVFGESGY